MTVTCTFYSLSNEAPHKVGAVFTPVRAPERVHLQDSSRKENYRKWPNFFTDININASKQGRIPLLWRHHMQSLEASLYHCRKGRNKCKKDLTVKTLADPWETGALHREPSSAAGPGLGGLSQTKWGRGAVAGRSASPTSQHSSVSARF